jgi:HAD superfamily hydrolase (TIGR01509 family)
MQPSFLYFDLGKVLVEFSLERMMVQAAAAAGVAVERVRHAMLDDQLLYRYEKGQVSSRDFFETFCAAADCRPDYDRLVDAFSEIFAIHLPVLPIIAQLRQAGYRLGVLSNTCEVHWEYCVAHYDILSDVFDVYALSFRIGASKPDAAIFRAAAEMAGHQPEDVFFVDDIAENVAGARAFGFDAVQFTSASALAADLRRRGLRFNY